MPDAVTPTVVLLAGSLRSGSHTTALLRRAGQLLPAGWTVLEVDDIRSLPHYDADLDGEAATVAVRRARTTIDAAAGVIISTPEYNSTIPGGLKNWVDWITRPARSHVLIGKPVAVLGASPNGRGAVAAVTWLRDILGRLGAIVVGDTVAIPEIVERFGTDGALDSAAEQQLAELVAALVAAVTERAQSDSAASRS